MKILDRSNVGCPMCSRIPVPSEEDLQWMHSGQPLISLMAEAFEEQKRKAREEAEQAAAPEKSEDSSQSALESMSQAMNDLEKLFGFDEPAEPEPESDPQPEDPYDPLVADDIKQEPLMYLNQGNIYFLTSYKDTKISFCPFCGSKLEAEKSGVE